MDRPDRLEYRIRFGCGALFGALVVGGLFLLRTMHDLSWPWWLAVSLGAAVWCGCAARRRGDEFWWDVLEDRWWW